MLSNIEKEEMIKDSQNIFRRESFRFAKSQDSEKISFDEYLKYLNDIQKIFGEFTISKKSTETKFNKL